MAKKPAKKSPQKKQSGEKSRWPETKAGGAMSRREAAKPDPRDSVMAEKLLEQSPRAKATVDPSSPPAREDTHAEQTGKKAIPVSPITGKPLSFYRDQGMPYPQGPLPEWMSRRVSRGDDDLSMSTEPRHYKAPILRIPGNGHPSEALAAFRMGRLGVSMTVVVESVWDDLVRRCANFPLTTDASFIAIPEAAEEILEARRVLMDSILPEISDRLHKVVDQLTDFNRKIITQFDIGQFNITRSDSIIPPWESLCRELEWIISRTLATDHPLRPFFDLGVAFGEFSVQTTNYYTRGFNDHAHTDGSASKTNQVQEKPDFFPEIGKLARLGGSLPADILKRSSLLNSLAEIALDYEQIGERAAFERYFKENSECWSDTLVSRASDPTPQQVVSLIGSDGENLQRSFSNHPEIDDEMIASHVNRNQIRRVEADLANIKDLSWEYAVRPPNGDSKKLDMKPSWNRETLKLSFNGMVIRKLRADADNVFKILDAYEEDGWVSKIDNPISGSPTTTHEDRLKDAVDSLNSRLKKNTITFEATDDGSVQWYPTSEH
jgi:hypothetical protein